MIGVPAFPKVWRFLLPILLLGLPSNSAGSNLNASRAGQLLAKADSLSLHAQIDASDSLNQILLTYYRRQNDLNKRFQVYNNLVRNRLLLFDHQQARIYLDHAHALHRSSSKGNPVEWGRYYMLTGRMNFIISQWDQSKKAYDQAISFLQKRPEGWPYLVETYLYYSQLESQKRDSKLIKEFIDRAIELLLQHSGEKNHLWGQVHQYLSRYYRLLGDYISSKNEAEKWLKNNRHHFGEMHPYNAVAYYFISEYYQQRGDYDKELSFLKKAEHIWEHYRPHYRGRRGHYYSQLGDCQRRRGQFEEAHRNLDSALMIISSFMSENSFIVGQMYLWKGLVYQSEDQYEPAIRSYETCRNIFRAIQYSGRHLSAVLLGLAECYLETGALQEAATKNEQARKSIVDFYGVDHPDMIRHLGISARLEEKMGHSRNALVKIQLALEKASTGFTPKNLFDNPDPTGIIKVQAALSLLEHKGRLLTLLSSLAEMSRREAALRTYEIALALVFRLRQEYNQEEGRQRIFETGFQIFEKSIALSYELSRQKQTPSYIRRAYQLAEQSQSLLLREALIHSKASRFAGVPDSLLEHEKELLAEINYLKSKEAPEVGLSRANIQREERRLLKLTDSLEAAREKLKRDYPRFYQLKYSNEIADIDSIAGLLPLGQGLIKFFIGKQHIFVFVIKHTGFQLYQLDIPQDFSNQVLHFRRSLSDIQFIKREKQLADSLLIRHGHQLYQLLLDQPLQWLGPDIRKLIIVPDGPLGHLPFELLLTEAPIAGAHYGTYPFMLKDYQIHYAYSATLWQQSGRTSPIPPEALFAGFTPAYQKEMEGLEAPGPAGSSRDHYYLPSAQREVETIARMLNGDVWKQVEATEANFKRESPRYGILHLSMHAELNDQSPNLSRLIFSRPDSLNDGDLMIAELYNMQLAANLVVLSACNSGMGQIQKGEGVMSLARAFAYAGVPSMLMSLWAVPDDATTALMIEFYRELKKKQRKDEALRNSKLTYLANTKDPLFSHPYFWGGFVLIGDAQALSLPSSNKTILWWLAPVIFVGSISYFIFRKR